jgi:hypothetical protein
MAGEISGRSAAGSFRVIGSSYIPTGLTGLTGYFSLFPEETTNISIACGEIEN